MERSCITCDSQESGKRVNYCKRVWRVETSWWGCLKSWCPTLRCYTLLATISVYQWGSLGAWPIYKSSYIQTHLDHDDDDDDGCHAWRIATHFCKNVCRCPGHLMTKGPDGSGTLDGISEMTWGKGKLNELGRIVVFVEPNWCNSGL